MATNELKTRIKHAYKTESDWTSSNPVLLKGEVAYSSDKNNKYKVGDGTHKWSDLAYAIPVTKSDIGLGSVDNTADSAKSVKYATSAGSATTATSATNADNATVATKIVDYNNQSQSIKVGYGGNGISGNEIKYIAGYTTGDNASTARIKDVSKDSLRSWLSINNIDNTSDANKSIKEANLSWGGKNFSGNYGCIDAAMVPELGANRLAFMPANAIEIQYSRDGGATWSTYTNTSDREKIDLFNGNAGTYYIGGTSENKIDRTKYQVRFTITTDTAKVYTQLNKFVIYLSTNGSTGSWCTIDAKTKANVDSGTDTWTTFADKVSVSGWSGYNVINVSGITTYGNNSSHYQKLRFTFGVTSHASTVAYNGLQINKILGFGGVGWNTPSTMAKSGHMYTYDASKNVTFPAGVTATSFNGNATSATQLKAGSYGMKADLDGYILPINNTYIGKSNSQWDTAYIKNLRGNADTATALTTSAGSATQPVYFSSGKPVATAYTLGKSVPSTAVFTDTDTKVTSVGNHYTPSGGTTKSASSGTATNATGSGNAVQVVTGVTVDAAGHVTGVTSKGVYSTDTNTTYSDVTTSTHGLMTPEDKTKLDGIAKNANNYSLPTASSSTLGGVKTTSAVTSTTGLTACPIISGVPYYKDTDTNTDTKVTNTLATTTKAYVTGTTSASTNTGTQVFDTGVYLDTTVGRLHMNEAQIGTNNEILINNNMITCGTNKPIRLNDTETDNNEGKHVVVGSPGIMVKGGVCLTNGSGLYARRADSDDWKHLAGIDTNNNTLYGTSSYNDKIGDVYYRGNNMYIQSNTDIQISSKTAGLTNRSYGVNKVLWSGSIYPKAADTATLSEAISAQPNGIVIFFQWYGEGTPRAADMICHFIPKYLCTNFGGGYTVSAIDYDGRYAMSKYLYIGDTSIMGVDFNGEGAKTTDSGVKVTNWNYIMTRVIGV